MIKYFVFTLLLFLTSSFLSAQEKSFSEKELIGCWELFSEETPNLISLYLPCDSKTTGQRIKFNSYGQYHVYPARSSRGRCGTPAGGSSGRFVFNKKEQTLKLIDSRKQQITIWNILKTRDGGFSIDKNSPQQRI